MEASATDDMNGIPTTTGPNRMPRRKVHSIYFGGGTPSLAKASMVEAILSKIRTLCDVPENIEISLEGNPTSIETSKLRSFRHAGINRLSLGIQSLSDADLKFLGRDHTVAETLDAVKVAQSVFDRISMDFIWGRPGQSVKMWEEELKQACSLGATHLSLYQLTVERGTPLHKAVDAKRVEVPDVDLSADFYDATLRIAEANNYHQYEVSSFALNGKEENRSMHNQSYWKGLDYVGIGPGAHGRMYGGLSSTRYRSFRILDPNAWMRQCETVGHGMRRIVPMSKKEAIEELVVLGLRTTDGITARTFGQHSGGIRMEEFLDMDSVNAMVENSLLNVELDNLNLISRLAPTQKGLAVMDRVTSAIIKPN